MNRQKQWLFEAPFAPKVTQYTTPYATPEYFSNSELADGCQSRTSDCPPSGVAAEIVGNYITHATKVPEGEKRKIRAVADSIVRNANQGSQSIKVCIVGHADKDPRGENFERNISSQRAVEVMNELTSVISNPSILSTVSWKLICAGKDNPVIPFNKPLAQRLRNRRVEIFLNVSPLKPVPVTENSCGNLLIWINAFIPGSVPGYTFTIPTGSHAGKTAIPCPLAATPANPNCFRLGYLTDQRTFDDKPTASVRMRSIAEIQLVSPKLIRTDHQTSGTTEINRNTGAITCFDRADMKRCKFNNFASSSLPFPSGDFLIKLSVEAAASDPCVNLAADIDYEGNIEILCSPSRGIVEVGFNGKLDSFPAFEMYAKLNGTTKNLFRLPPPPGNTVVNLLGGASTPISGKAVFNCSLINKGAPALTARPLRTRPLAGIR